MGYINYIDEYLSGYCTKIRITLHKNEYITVLDNVRVSNELNLLMFLTVKALQATVKALQATVKALQATVKALQATVKALQAYKKVRNLIQKQINNILPLKLADCS
ncbi:MAG: hypothetical protein ACE19N_00995 [Candidatus Karelsulcia muelleri]